MKTKFNTLAEVLTYITENDYQFISYLGSDSIPAFKDYFIAHRNELDSYYDLIPSVNPLDINSKEAGEIIASAWNEECDIYFSE